MSFENSASLESARKMDANSAKVTISLFNISKLYSGVAALSDVSVSFNAGEVHAVLGENGAGKSTLMSIISGVNQPNTGTIEFEGRNVSPLMPDTSADLGIAISYQHPAILDDLSVLENLQVSLPKSVFEGRSAREVARGILETVGLQIPLRTRAAALTVGQKQMLEIGKALATNPKVLILDEPTAALDKNATEILFDQVRKVAARGTAVIYITHRLAEIRQIAQRVTVLRDGKVGGGGLVSELSDDAVLNMIVGRKLESAFPPKSGASGGREVLTVRNLTGSHFKDVSFEAHAGEIVGVAGVAGNGQSEFMRALAGLDKHSGDVLLDGNTVSHRQLTEVAAFMPADRLNEGISATFSVRENAALGALSSFATAGVVSRKKEMEDVTETFKSLAVKTPGMEAKIKALSGGNQQKVVLARALLEQPRLIVADEPTQGVDVGARFEMYRILREISAGGKPVIVNSSDASELEGLCDKVIVFSLGRVVATLTGDDVTEANIVAAAVNAQHDIVATERTEDSGKANSGGSFRHFIQTDNAPAVPLLIVLLGLAMVGYNANPNFLSSFNIYNMLMLATALCFISLGQTVVLMLRGVDLSVGPLAGFLVVAASFFINDGQTTATIALGFLLMLVGAVAVGTVNGVLIRFGKFTPIAATLAMYMGLQGLSFLMREGPGGYINFSVTSFLSARLGPVPYAFLFLVLCVVISEFVLRRTRFGWQLRSIGSNEESARRIGIHNNRISIIGYVLCALFVGLGALMLMAQIGVGDPQQGTSYTLSSITAVVLGGTSLAGGRGSFFGTAVGALLLTEVLAVISFLGLAQMHQYLFQGLLVVGAAIIYSTVRGRSAG